MGEYTIFMSVSFCIDIGAIHGIMIFLLLISPFLFVHFGYLIQAVLFASTC